MLSFRHATLDDLDFCLYAKESSFRAIVELLKPYDVEKERIAMEGRIARGEVEIVSGGEVAVGYFSTEAIDGELWLHNLFFPPEHQSRGYGSQVLAHVHARARHAGLALRLRVLHVNPRAQAFYAREGMVEVERTETHVHFGFS